MHVRIHLLGRKRRRSWLAHGGRGVVFVLQFCVVVLGALLAMVVALAMVARDHPVELGDWTARTVAAAIENRLSEQGITAHLDGLAVSFRDGLVPAIEAQNVTLNTAAGAPMLELQQATVVLDRDSLLLGQVRPAAISLDGLHLDAVKGAGSVAFDIDGTRILEAVQTPGEFLLRLGALLDRPMLSRLDAVALTGLDLRVEDTANHFVWASRRGSLRITRAGSSLEVAMSLDEFGDGAGDAGGVLRATLSADLATGEGQARLAARGLNPRILLPTEGAAVLAKLAAIDAPLSFDLAADLDQGGKLRPMLGRLAVGQGLWVLPGDRPVLIRGAEANLRLDAQERRLSISDISLDSDRLGMAGRATVLLNVDAKGVLSAAEAQLNLASLNLAQGIGFAQATDFADVAASLRLDFSTGRLSLSQGSLDYQGRPVRLSGYVQPGTLSDADRRAAARIKAAEPLDYPPSERRLPDGWSAGIDVSAAGLDRDQVMALWPPAIEDDVRDWVDGAVRGGAFGNIRISARLPAVGRPDAGISFRFTDGRVLATDGLPELRGAQGMLSLQDRHLAVAVSRASMVTPDGSVARITNALASKPDVLRREAPLHVTGHAAVAASGALALVGLPLVIDDGHLPLAPKDLGGQAVADITLSIPMGPNHEGRKLGFDITGKVTGARNATLLPGKHLAAPELDVAATGAGISIAGDVTLDGLPAHALWTKPLGTGTGEAPSTLKLTAPLTRELAGEFGVPFTAAEMTGRGTLAATVTLPAKGVPRLMLDGDLAGLRLALPGTGWSKPAAAAGTLQLAGSLGDVPSFDKLAIRAPGLAATGKLALSATGGLQQLSFSKFSLGGWLNAPVTVRPAKGDKIALTLGNGSVDLRKLPDAAGGGGSGSAAGGSGGLSVVTLAGSQVIVSDTMRLTAVKGQLDPAHAMAGTLSARMNDGAALDVTLSGPGGAQVIRARSADAGGVLRDAGLWADGQGGTMDLRLTQQAGGYLGRLKIGDITVKDAPLVAQVLSAVSIVGLFEQAGAGGLHFGTVDADFSLSKDRLVLHKASATGPSLGLSLDGTADLDARTMDLQGVVSPFFFLNRVGQGMTRRGEGLFGVTFALKGPVDKPQVSANPLSLLAPGPLRGLFRRDAPDLDTNTGG